MVSIKKSFEYKILCTSWSMPYFGGLRGRVGKVAEFQRS